VEKGGEKAAGFEPRFHGWQVSFPQHTFLDFRTEGGGVVCDVLEVEKGRGERGGGGKKGVIALWSESSGAIVYFFWGKEWGDHYGKQEKVVEECQ